MAPPARRTLLRRRLPAGEMIFENQNSNGQHDNLLADHEVKYAASDL